MRKRYAPKFTMYLRCIRPGLLTMISLSLMFAGCSGGGASGKCSVKITQAEGCLVFENGMVKMSFDINSGRFTELENKQAAIPYTGNKPPLLFLVKAGENNNTISPGRKNAGVITTTVDKGTARAEINYEDMVYDVSGKPTGISIVAHLSLQPEQSYLRVSYDVKVAQGGESVMALSFLADGSFGGTGGEYLAMPMWSTGNLWEKPAENLGLKDGVRLGYPGKNDLSLQSCFMDYYTPGGAGGLGIAYINSSEMIMEVQVATKDGVSFSPTLFEPKQLLGKSVPLTAGAVFRSGDLIIAPHTGDWHAIADIYRNEYEAAFVLKDGSPDYLTAKDIDPKLLGRDIICSYPLGMDNDTIFTFAGAYDKVVESLKLSMPEGAADGSTSIVWLVGENAKGYAYDVPMMLPAYGKGGGTPALLDMVKKLKAMNCLVLLYKHPFAVDPDGAGYIPESDPKQHTETWDCVTHHSVCIDNEAVQSLWKDTVIPDLKNAGADAIQFDQGSLQQTVCDLPGHNHGLDCMSRLTSHIKAIDELSQYVRKEIGFIMSEGGSDLATRHVDLWQSGWYRKPVIGGGTKLLSMHQYIFPQYRFMYDTYVYTPGGNVDAVLQCAIRGGVMTYTATSAFDVDRFREFTRFQKEIRAADAPGFPFGFRDNIGLAAPEGITACAFVDGSKVTVTYCTDGKEAHGVIAVDLQLLGIQGCQTVNINVSLDAYKAGFTNIDCSNIKQK